MKNIDSNMEIRKPTELDKAVKEVVSRPFSREELGGFGKPKIDGPKVVPYFDVRLPSKSERRPNVMVEIGVQGSF